MISNAALLIMLSLAGGGSSETVDSILAKTWQSQGIDPAAVCSDEEFLRRVSLDLIGRIPTLDELTSFESNSDRAAKIDELLASDEPVLPTLLREHLPELGCPDGTRLRFGGLQDRFDGARWHLAEPQDEEV